MKKTLQLLVFVLALATAFALAQTSYGGTSPQTQNPTANPNPSVPTDQGTATTPASQDTKKQDKNKSTVDDSTLDTQIKQQLSGDPAMKNVQATVSKGVVNLDGTVATKGDKKRAKQMVAAIPGVRKVHDKLTVNANATVTPGSNEPASASVGTTGATTSAAGASSTTPQAPSSSASSTTTHESGAPAAGMPQGDVSAGANTGVGTGAQTQAGAGVSGATSSTTPQSPATSATGTTSTPQAPATSTTGAASTTTSPQSSATGTAGASAAPSSTLPQSSAAGTTGATAAGTAPAPGTPGDIGSDLQKQIDTALKHEPTLANDNINAVVAGDTIDLSGSVASGKERQTALRIAQSFAGNRRVVDHLTVAGQGPGASMGGQTPNQGATGTSNPSATPSNPNASPESTNNPR
jgi:osmotically-inducible protein OsmY